MEFTKRQIFTLDENECSELSPCSINATCQNAMGSFVCTCKSGFNGDGLSCTGIFLVI